jgi:hypothetical protein
MSRGKAMLEREISVFEIIELAETIDECTLESR